jgi:hypothetical protein
MNGRDEKHRSSTAFAANTPFFNYRYMTLKKLFLRAMSQPYHVQRKGNKLF